MKAEKVWRQDYYTIVKVYTTQSGYVCANYSHTHTFISTSVAVILNNYLLKMDDIHFTVQFLH